MNSSKEMLTSLLKITQMGQIYIRVILGEPMHPGLRKILEEQLTEYEAIESEVSHMAGLRGWELPTIDPAVGFFSKIMTRGRLICGNSDSKIADMMIRRNTGSMIAGLKSAHQCNSQDVRVRILTRKLLDCETANIRQMQIGRAHV